MGWNMEIRKLKFEAGNCLLLTVSCFLPTFRHWTILAFRILFNMGCLPNEPTQDI